MFNLKNLDANLEEEHLEDLNRILDIVREYSIMEDECRCYNSMGLRYHKAGKYKEALEYYNKALKIANEIEDLSIKGKILNNIAYIKWAQEEYQEAKKYFKEAINLSEVYMEELVSPFEPIEIEVELNPYYGMIELLFDVYKKTKDKNNLYEALKFIEIAKTLEIINILQLFNIIEKFPPDKIELIKKERLLVSDMINIKKELVDLHKRKRELHGLLQKYKRFEDQTTIKETIDKLENEVIKLKNEIKSKNEQLLNLGNESRKLRTEIVENLEDSGLIKPTIEFNPLNDLMRLFEIENVVVWELFYVPNSPIYKNKFKILVMESKNIELFEVKNFDSKKFMDSFQIFIKMINDPVLKYYSFEKLIEIKDTFTNILPKELLDTLENKSKLVLIPHNLLHLVPWEAIEPVGLKIPICRNYSLRILDSCINKNKFEEKENQLFFVSNPTFNSFPALIAEKEINGIISLLDNYKIPYLLLKNEEASKEKFLEIINKNNIAIVHFGGYTNFDPLGIMRTMAKKEPKIEKTFFCGLLFYNEQNYSTMGINELINNGFNTAPLFILDIIEFEDAEESDIYNYLVLIRGLMLAGIPSVIAPNWQIMEDIIPDFMLEFYHNITRGLDVCESLFESRKKVWVNSKRPVFYGVYALYGNPFKKFNLE
ncbi:MAG: CHAT domain-containing protein [Candidatus Helarchaeota archaeon]